MLDTYSKILPYSKALWKVGATSIDQGQQRVTYSEWSYLIVINPNRYVTIAETFHLKVIRMDYAQWTECEACKVGWKVGWKVTANIFWDAHRKYKSTSFFSHMKPSLLFGIGVELWWCVLAVHTINYIFELHTYVRSQLI